MRIAVIGTGYVGLVSAVGFAHLAGHEVICVDTDRELVDRINHGEPVLHESGLPELLREVIAAKKLRATTDYAEALANVELVLVCVGTPYLPNGAIDLCYVESAAKSIGAELVRSPNYVVVAVKSTVVPGTTEGLVLPLIELASGLRAGQGFGLAMTPEFLREGVALEDFLHPDRLVLGAYDDRSYSALEQLYAAHQVPKQRVNLRTAELTKYVANAYLALHISFANEIALLAERLGSIDVREVLEGVYLDKRHAPEIDGQRVQPQVLNYFVPNCGFGGSCLPKDVMALTHKSRELGFPPPLLDGITVINRKMPQHLVERVSAKLGGLRGVTVAVLGLAFKPGTDDVRESPALPIIQALVARGAYVHAIDPLAGAILNFKAAADNPERVEYFTSLADGLTGAAAALLVTPWPEFDVPAKDYAHALAGGALFFDGRCRRDPAEFTAAGLIYDGIGYAK